MKFLSLAKSLAAALALLALAYAGLRAALLFQSIEETTRQAPALIAAEGERTRVAALVAITETRADLLARVDRLGDKLIESAESELRATRTEASAHIVGLAGVADERMASLQDSADQHLIRLNETVALALARAGDRVDQIGIEVQATVAESRRTIHDLHPQLLGLVAASKVAAGELATSGRDFQRAVPVLIANSTRATDASARLVENIALASKPLPKWMRVVLAIAPPLAATGASAVGAGAALGAFR